MPWQRYDNDDGVEFISSLHDLSPSAYEEPTRSSASPAVIAVGVALAVVGGALLSALGTGGLDSLLNSTGFVRITSSHTQQQSADTLAAMDQKIAVITAEVAALKSARSSSGLAAGTGGDADIMALKSGIDNLAAETGYLDLRVEAVARRTEAATNEGFAKLNADIHALKSEIADMRALQGELLLSKSPLAGRLDGFEAGLTVAEKEITGLRSSLDGFATTNRGAFAAITKRLDKIESVIGGSDMTGSLPRQPARKRSYRASVAGWSLHEAAEGKAVISGRTGTFKVGQGAIVPGLGRVDAVRQQGNRWIVMTNKGPIVGRTAASPAAIQD